MIKEIIRKLTPGSLLERHRRRWRLREQKRNRNKTTEEVFTGIYEKKQWGGAQEDFCSGTGSTDEKIVSRYIAVVTDKAFSEGFMGRAFVDLGCGDFRVGRQLLPLCSTYIGVDIVKPLIRRNQQMYGNETTSFVHLDIINDELPDGDVCFIRQVLQHLSNQEIIAVLQKLVKFRWVIITDHNPSDNEAIRPNMDKVHGGDIRVCENSGL